MEKVSQTRLSSLRAADQRKEQEEEDGVAAESRCMLRTDMTIEMEWRVPAAHKACQGCLHGEMAALLTDGMVQRSTGRRSEP